MFEHSDFEYIPLNRFDRSHISGSAKRGRGKGTQFDYILEDTVGLLYNKQKKNQKKMPLVLKRGRRIKNLCGKLIFWQREILCLKKTFLPLLCVRVNKKRHILFRNQKQKQFNFQFYKFDMVMTYN